LLPLLLKQGILVYATHNTGKDCASNVVYIDRSEGLRMVRARVVTCALWLAPTDDAATVADFAREVPTFVVSSMALAEHLTKGGDPAKLNPYQMGKLAMFNVAGVYSVAPGFFIEDGEDGAAEIISDGLHGDTTNELLRPLGAPFWAGKFTYNKPPMSVTLKSKLADVITAWVINPSAVLKPNTFTVLCTDGEYSRLHLRTLALGDFVPAPTPDLYSALPHPIVDGVPVRIEDKDVGKALNRRFLKRQKKVDYVE